MDKNVSCVGDPFVCSEIAPSGVEVSSTVQFPEFKWWDRPTLHVFWSWASWGTLILVAYGISKPRSWFEIWAKRS